MRPSGPVSARWCVTVPGVSQEDLRDLIQDVVAQAPADVLRLLADVAAQSPDDRPLVSVHLGSGQTLVGAVAGVGAQRRGQVDQAVVLVDRHSGSLGFAMLENVVAVELHNPRPFQDVLTGGRLPLPEYGEPVSRLALRREFAPVADFPVVVDWDAVGGSERLLGNLARLLGALRDAAGRVLADELGRQAWAQVRELRVEHRAAADASAAGLSVQRTADGLAVHADLSAALPRALADELFRQISAQI